MCLPNIIKDLAIFAHLGEIGRHTDRHMYINRQKLTEGVGSGSHDEVELFFKGPHSPELISVSDSTA